MAITIILDTSAYSAFNRGDQRLRKWFSADNEILVPLIVVGELRAGFACGSKREFNEELLARFVNAPSVGLITITSLTTRFFADVFLGLRQAGTPIGTSDMWIAAMALELGHPLLTLDTDFSCVAGLKLVTI